MPSAVHEISFNSVRVFWLDSDQVLSRLRERVKTITADPAIRTVVLFGSFAEGRAVPGSDLDILVVLEHDPREPSERIPDFIERFSGLGIPVDVFAFTVDELENPIAKHALSQGRVLFLRST